MPKWLIRLFLLPIISLGIGFLFAFCTFILFEYGIINSGGRVIGAFSCLFVGWLVTLISAIVQIILGFKGGGVK